MPRLATLAGFLAIALSLLALVVQAAAPARVPAADVVAAAQAVVQARADAAGIDVRLAPVGRVSDVSLPAGGDARIIVGNLPERWLRPRLGVPVTVQVAGEKRAALTVWFSVAAAATGPVYAEDFNRGTRSDALALATGDIDLARTHGADAADATRIDGLRLAQSVRAGQPALASDFEAVPAVLAQQAVRIESTRGVVRLSIAGRALADGATGQVIAVLPAGATQPVRARVVSSQVVAIEN